MNENNNHKDKSGNTTNFKKNLSNEKNSEISGLFDDVQDVSALNSNDVIQRISEYLEENNISEGADVADLNDEFEDDIITLTDNNGNNFNYVEVASMQMNGKVYALLQSVDEYLNDGIDSETIDNTEVYVFEVSTDSDGEKIYESVEDDETLDDVVKNYEVMLNEYYNSMNSNENM